MSRRIERIAEQIQQEVGLLLLDGVKDPRIRSVTLTGVQVTPDLGLARVYYTLLVDEPAARRAAALGLQSTTPFLRRVLGQRLHLRRVPQLEFHFDETGNKAARIDRLLETIRTELAESESSTATAALPSGDDDARWDDDDADPGDDDEKWDDSDADPGDDDEKWEDDDADPEEDDDLDPGEDDDADPGEDETEWVDDDQPMEEDETWRDPAAEEHGHGRR